MTKYEKLHSSLNYAIHILDKVGRLNCSTKVRAEAENAILSLVEIRDGISEAYKEPHFNFYSVLKAVDAVKNTDVPISNDN